MLNRALADYQIQRLLSRGDLVKQPFRQAQGT